MKYLFVIILTYSLVSCSQLKTWESNAKKLSNEKFEQKIQASKYNITKNPFLQQIERWNTNKNLSGKDIYNKIINWEAYPNPKNTGIIIEKKIELDSTYSVPYYIYIPKNYSNDLPTKLLIYYKGGWISRDSLPNNVAKEIIIDNPTFKYLDKYNVVEVFPALENKLAIYGFYGYKYLRLILADTKKILNIDDNQVYLAGFSDGGSTVYNIAFLRPSQYASFFSINGTINNSNMNYPNFSSREITTYSGLKDELVNYHFPLSIAEKANEFGANWKIRLLDKGHFYFPYEKEILPDMFNQMMNSNRNPFPNSIIYHKDFDFNELNGVDWLHIVKTNPKREPEKWHYSSEVKIKRTENEVDTFVYGEKTSQIIANYFNNTFTLKSSLIDEFEIYISPIMVDINRSVKIIVNDKEVYNKKISYNKSFMIKNFKERFDRKQVWINKITIMVN